MTQPTIGRVVHYVSHGTPVQPDGSRAFEPQCRAAVVTEVPFEAAADGSVGLCVVNPTGLFFHQGVVHHETPQTGDDIPGGGPHNHPPGTWHWPEEATDGAAGTKEELT